MTDHPLQEDLSQLSSEELDKKYNELSRRWHIAKRMQMDEYVLHQLDVMLTGMEMEKERRMILPEDDKHVILDTDPLEKKDKHQ